MSDSSVYNRLPRKVLGMRNIRAKIEELTQDLLTEAEVADFLGVSKACLRRWRYDGGNKGPPFVKLGRQKQAPVRYVAKDVAEFAQRYGKLNSTSQTISLKRAKLTPEAKDRLRAELAKLKKKGDRK